VKILFSIILGFSTLLVADFTRLNGVVTDTKTGLQWQDDYNDNQVEFDTWVNAIKYCEDLKLNSYSDWKLPNIKELTSLIDDSKFSPAVNEVFQNINSLGYISSTTHASDSFVAWHISFNNGTQYTRGKAFNDGYILCVR